MLKLTKKVIAPLAAVVGLTGMAFEAQATPAFARQMDMNCMSCHNQSVPMLNSFGRAFKLSGYTMTSGNKSMITGGDLGISVPVAINAGVGMKSTYTQSDATNARSELAIPAGSAIMIGGKVSDNMGANVLFNGDGIVHMQVAYSAPVAAGNAGITYYGTMGHGPFIGIESNNTGLHKELQMFDSSSRTNAIQSRGMGLGKGPASGLTAFYGGNGLKVAAGIWSLGFNSTYTNGGLDTDGGFGRLYRLTYDTPQLAGWDFTVGAFGVSGTHEGTTATLFENTGAGFASAPWLAASPINEHEVNSNGFDIQAQGQIAGIDTQVILANVSSYEFKINTLNSPPAPANPVNMDFSATSLEMQIMPTSAIGIRLGYMTSTNNNAATDADTKTTGFGVNYNYADNVRFSLEKSTVSPDGGTSDTQTLLTTIVAF